MSRTKRTALLPCLLLLLLSVSAGCNDHRVVDRIRILMVLGFDKDASGYRGTGLYTDLTHGGKVKSVQGKAKTVKLVLDDMNNQSPQPVRIAKMKLLIVSKALAESGITPLVKSICKDPLISHYIIMAVADGSAASIMESLAGEHSDSLPYHLIEQNFTEGNVPYSNLKTFLYDYYGEGRDAAVPYLRLNSYGKIEIAGYGVFRNDRLVSVLNREDMLNYKLLQGRYMKGDLAVPLTNGQQKDVVVFASRYGKEARSVARQDDGWKITYNLLLYGMVKDYPVWIDLRKKEEDEQLIEQLEQQIRSRLTDFLYRCRNDRVDPLGVGDFVRAHSRSWDETHFYETDYPKITFDVNLNLRVSKSGIGE